MNAGRELDALVAEKVMGWVIGEKRITRPDGSSFDGPECGMPEDDVYRSYSIPAYSTSIADAWLVVEKHLHKGLQYFALDCFYTKGKVGIWFDPDDFHQFPPDVIGSTVAHAICLAALKLKSKECGE